MNNATSATPSFTADRAGAYKFQLFVSDAFATSGLAEVIVTVITAEDFAQERAKTALNIITNPQTPVTTEGNRKALANFLEQAIAALQVGDLARARNKLTDALSRTDGCALRGAVDGNGPGRDWITACSPQLVIYAAITAAKDAITP